MNGFYDAAMGAGAADNGKPGVRLYYDPRYYAANVFDPDGYSLEAVYETAGSTPGITPLPLPVQKEKTINPSPVFLTANLPLAYSPLRRTAFCNRSPTRLSRIFKLAWTHLRPPPTCSLHFCVQGGPG